MLKNPKATCQRCGQPMKLEVQEDDYPFLGTHGFVYYECRRCGTTSLCETFTDIDGGEEAARERLISRVTGEPKKMSIFAALTRNVGA